MEPASLIGFGLALAFAGWSSSMILGGGLLVAGPWLRSRGPEAERVAAASALVLPAIVAFAVAVGLLGRSLAIPVLGLDDHCPAHAHHLHLCLFHGAGWAEQAWTVGAVALVGTVVGLRSIHLGIGQVVAARALTRIARVATVVRTGETEVLVAPSSRVFFFVAGLFRPRIYVSSAAWEALGEDERRAAVAHERAHAGQGDVLRHLAYCLCALVGAPILARRALARWASATERVCDRRAAEAVGDAGVVARALVTLARQSREPSFALGTSFVPAAADLALRVESLLGDPPVTRAAGRLRALSAFLVAGVVTAAAVGADPLHHALESLLGML